MSGYVLVGFLAALFGCDNTPDPRTMEGFVGFLAQGVEENDAGKLYRALDVRARHAMISIVNDRRAAAQLIRADYPEDEREPSLQWLGDAAEVENAEALFARRCDSGCRAEIGRVVGAVTAQHETDYIGQIRVVTTRGELDAYREGDHQWWGLVWNTYDLHRERDRANRDLAVVERNAATFRRRAELEQ